jgi:hypothetical protein
MKWLNEFGPSASRLTDFSQSDLIAPVYFVQLLA